MQGGIGDKLAETMEVLNEQEWVEQAAEPLQSGLVKLYESSTFSRKLENFLHGVWLGHPLHPVLITVPLGSWTLAAILDLYEEITDKKDLRRGADAAVAVGVAGAVASAATGMADWSRLGNTPARRSGLVHASLNTVALLLYLISMVLRGGKERGAGRILSLAGFIISMFSGYIGGDMVYRQRIGVDHSPSEHLPDQFVPIMAETELPEGEMRQVEVHGISVMLARCDGQVYALANSCAHLGGPLADGMLSAADCSVQCPWHGSRFALEDGHTLDGPSAYSQPAYETRLNNGQIEVRQKGQV